MSDDKEIRFTEKKIDESWKEQADRDKKILDQQIKPKANAADSVKQETSKPFINLLTSLGYQALFHLGEMPNPETQESEINLPAAKEIIDLLTSLKNKTAGNLSAEESRLLESLLPELQMKFAQKA